MSQNRKNNLFLCSIFFSILLCTGFFFALPVAQAGTNCICLSTDKDCAVISDVIAGGCTVEACTKNFGEEFTSFNVDIGGAAKSTCDNLHSVYANNNSTSANEKKKIIAPTLNVQIPNLKFTDAVSGTCTSPDQKGQCIKSNFLAEYLNAVYAWMIGAGITIAIVLVMVGGLQYTLSAGGSEIGKARERIANAITGIILLLCVYLILNTINPQLTSLKTVELQNIPPEDIDSGSIEG